MQIIPLREMAKGQKGTIEGITAKGELARRIRAMGITSGSTITICGRAPLRDPVAVRVMGSTLTLRNNEADYILVAVVS